MATQRGIVYGVGTCTPGKYEITNPDGSLTRERCMWKGMLERCYSAKYQAKKPTYAGCTVSAEFLDFQTFMLWAEKQVGFNEFGFRLDKDILVRGNKVYSAETCCFVPHEVNSLFVKKDANRGEYPVGVTFNKRLKKFVAQLSVDGQRLHLGCFGTAEWAFAVYKGVKQGHIQAMAKRYRGVIDPRVYDALMVYEVREDD
jgi:hypothetical protein